MEIRTFLQVISNLCVTSYLFPLRDMPRQEIMHFFNNGLDLAQLTPDKSSGHKQSFCEVGIPYFPISLKKCIEQTQIINFFFK